MLNYDVENEINDTATLGCSILKEEDCYVWMIEHNGNPFCVFSSGIQKCKKYLKLNVHVLV